MKALKIKNIQKLVKVEFLLSLISKKMREKIQKKYIYKYTMLGRLKTDCDYYLDCGRRNPRVLWARNEREQIKKMLELYECLPVKPKWLSMKEIKEYAKQMNVDIRKEK